MAQRQHGTHARYHHGPNQNDQPGGCRCQPCRSANTTYQQQRRRNIAYGRWPTAQYLDAAPVRAHLHQLQAAHIDLKHVATTAGLSTNTVWRIAAGRTTKVRPRIHAAILAINPRNGDGPRVSYIGIQRRARALARLGWTITRQAQLLGISPCTYQEIVAGIARVWPADKAAAVHALFTRLSWAPVPAGWIAERSRRNAQRAGWPPPAAWDDDTIDDPATQPHPCNEPDRSRRFDDDVDHVKVDAACAGTLPWSDLSRGEKTATVDQLAARRWTRTRMARHLHISGTTIAAYATATAASTQEAA